MSRECRSLHIKANLKDYAGGLRHCIGGSDQDMPPSKRKGKGKNGCLTRPYK